MRLQFEKILNLIKNTGDRLIILDKDQKNVFVVMDIKSYERLLSAVHPDLVESDSIEGHSSLDDQYLGGYEDSAYPEAVGKDQETEVIKGIDTEVVNIGGEMSEPVQAEENSKYYFEEVEPEESEEAK